MIGPVTSDSFEGEGVTVLLPGNVGYIECYLHMLSRDAPPPLPGGYSVGDKVFYVGANETLSNSDQVVHRGQGAVTGPATSDSHKDKGVKVLLPGNKENIECFLHNLSCAAPPPLRYERC